MVKTRPPRIKKTDSGRFYFVKYGAKHYFSSLKKFDEVLKKVMNAHQKKKHIVKKIIKKKIKKRKRKKTTKTDPKTIRQLETVPPIVNAYASAIQREQVIKQLEIDDAQKKLASTMTAKQKQEKEASDSERAIMLLYGTDAGVVPSIAQIVEAYKEKEGTVLSIDQATEIRTKIRDKYENDAKLIKTLTDKQIEYNKILEDQQQQIKVNDLLLLKIQEDHKDQQQQIKVNDLLLLKIEKEKEILNEELLNLNIYTKDMNNAGYKLTKQLEDLKKSTIEKEEALNNLEKYYKEKGNIWTDDLTKKTTQLNNLNEKLLKMENQLEKTILNNNKLIIENSTPITPKKLNYDLYIEYLKNNRPDELNNYWDDIKVKLQETKLKKISELTQKKDGTAYNKKKEEIIKQYDDINDFNKFTLNHALKPTLKDLDYRFKLYNDNNFINMYKELKPSASLYNILIKNNETTPEPKQEPINIEDEEPQDLKGKQEVKENDDEAKYVNDEIFGAGVGERGLSNHEIDNMMVKFSNYVGCWGNDEIKKIQIKPQMAFIINTKPIKITDGHWCGVYIDSKNSKSIEYFDPFGADPSSRFNKDIIKIVEKLNSDQYLKFKVNRIQVQNINSDNCGWHAMGFILDRMNGKKFIEATKYDAVNGENKAELLKQKFNYI